YHRTMHAAAHNRLFAECCIAPEYPPGYMDAVREGVVAPPAPHLYWPGGHPHVTLNFRLTRVIRIFISGASGLAALGFIAALALQIAPHGPKLIWRDEQTRRLASLCLVTLGLGCAFSVLAKPLVYHYMAPILPVLILGGWAFAGALADGVQTWGRTPGLLRTGVDLARRAAPAGLALLLLGAIFAAPYPGTNLAKHLTGDANYRAVLADAPEWLARVGGALEEALGPPNRDIQIATLLGAYVLGAGYGVYSELAGAPFFFDTNDRLAPDKLARLNGVSPDTVYGWLGEQDVRAILTGYNRHFEKEMVRYAEDNGFVAVPVPLYTEEELADRYAIDNILALSDWVLYVRPEARE
ncbi:MAG: hypothetical protein AAGL49_12415, partial [Pseudomonadota bacterium]